MVAEGKIHVQVLKLLAEAIDRKEYIGQFQCPKCEALVYYEINKITDNKNSIIAYCKNKCFTLTT